MDLPITPILCEEFAPYVGVALTPEVLSRIVARVTMRCYPGPVDISAIAPKQVGSYTLSCERLIDTLPQLRALHEEHWQETEGHRHSIRMNPDYPRGLDLELQGRYFLIVARHASGAVVGNYGLYLARSMHTSELIATEDTLFISSAHRKGRLGISMIRYAETALAQLGATELNVSVKLVNSVGPMIERMGYMPVGTQYTKILKEVAHVRA